MNKSGEASTKVLYVGCAQKKAEQECELWPKYEVEKIDHIAEFQGVNLYLSNIFDCNYSNSNVNLYYNYVFLFYSNYFIFEFIASI